MADRRWGRMMVVWIGLGAVMSAQVGRAQAPANAEHVAALIGILPLYRQALSTERPCDRTRQLIERQQMMEAIVASSLDASSTVAEIDFERAQIANVLNTLSSRRDKKIGWLTAANLVAGAGSGVVGTALQFDDRTAIAGDVVGLTGGIAGVALSIIAARQRGPQRPLGIAPNMLAPLFDRPVEARSVYPESVWRYLNTAPSNDPRIHVPWKEQLMSEWVRTGRVGAVEARESQGKIDLLASRILDHRNLSIDVLGDRMAMLTDVRSRVMLMNRDLRDLSRAISAIPFCGARE